MSGIEYADGTYLEGNVGTDRVCPSLNTSACSFNQKLVAITKATGLHSEEGGILGLWSGNISEYDTSFMMMPGLCASSSMTECVFSFYITGTTGSSYIDFGAINESIVTDTTKIAKMDILGDEGKGFWSQKVTGFRWGSDWVDDTEYAVREAIGITDTGTSCM